MYQDNQVAFGSTAVPLGKRGILKPDTDGYYTVVLGAFNAFNSVREYYDYSPSVRSLFESSSLFMRRIKEGLLYGEMGHPSPQVGETSEDFMRRAMFVNEKNVCVHIKRVWIDLKNVLDDNGRAMIAVIGLVKPAGPYADAAERSLRDPDQNTCFSVRALTADKMVGGIKYRSIRSIVTWDFVLESGISAARKYHSPALESNRQVLELSSMQVTKDLLKRLSDRSLDMTAGLGMESHSVSAVAQTWAEDLQWNRPSEPGWALW